MIGLVSSENAKNFILG